MSIAKRFLAMCMALAACLAAAVCMAPRAAAGQRFTIAYTGGIGVYPRSGPSMSSQHAGAALPEGSSVDVACELEGELVDNNTTPATKIWERLSDGTHIPNAYINSGADGWTPGVPRCTSPEPEQKKDDDPTSHIKATGPRTGNIRLDITYGPTSKSVLQVASQLYQHYYNGSSSPGADAYIDWRFFRDRKDLEEFSYRIPVGKQEVYKSFGAQDGTSLDLILGLGSFTVFRYSTKCFVIYDYYDFDDADIFYRHFAEAARTGKAKEFNVFSYGCYGGGSDGTGSSGDGYGGGGGGGGW